MTSYERLAFGYFVALAAVALVRRQPTTVLASGVAAAAVAAAPQTGAPAVREWLPHAWLVLGYWLPALLHAGAAGPTRFEQWLVRSDAWWRPRLPAVPPILQPVVEIAYLVCYPLVPATFAVVWAQGTAADVERFWMAVLVSGYASYVTLPWLVSRPPRLVEAAGCAPVGSVNVFVLTRVSHCWNTFPSGHAAVSTAAAIAVAPVSVPAAIVVGAFALAIAIGAAAGRYHYVIDSVLGVAAGVVAGGMASSL